MPDSPGLDVLLVTNVTITLLITAPSFTGGFPIRNYKIYESGRPIMTVNASGDRMEIAIGDLVPRRPYLFAVRASNGEEISEATVASTMTDGYISLL